MLFGVPVGQQDIHVDIDLSDIGVLSQSPSDMVFKGFSPKQFDSPKKFKKSTNLDSLPQIITENTTVFVYPFWGDQEQGEIAISKKNINIQYKFEPTCVFMGSIFTDSPKSYISKTCNPTKTSGKMSEMSSSQGTIEMIRETIDGEIERFDVEGGRVIDSNGVWCYQIPMNLDYVITDEYGNLVPTTDPTKGIPTRANVRFRVKLDDSGDDFTQNKTGMYLIPNNSTLESDSDYNFNTYTKKTSLVNVMWNKVYSVKNYIPRLQRRAKTSTSRNFIGLKGVNFHENNNPAPYNNIWININLRYMLMCFLSTFLLKLIGWINRYIITNLNFYALSDKQELPLIVVGRELFDECITNSSKYYNISYFTAFYRGLNSSETSRLKNEYLGITRLDVYNKINNTDYNRKDAGISINSTTGVLTINNVEITGLVAYEIIEDRENFLSYPYLTSDLVNCVETQLAGEEEVVNFDFNNDWINGSIYAPRFYTKIKRNRNNGIKNIKYCGSKSVNLELIQTCAPIITSSGSLTGDNNDCTGNTWDSCYKKNTSIDINEGMLTKLSDDFYYKSKLFSGDTSINLMSTDVILLGSLKEQDLDGIPQLHRLLPSTSFKLPPDNRDSEIITITGYTNTIVYDYGVYTLFTGFWRDTDYNTNNLPDINVVNEYGIFEYYNYSPYPYILTSGPHYAKWNSGTSNYEFNINISSYRTGTTVTTLTGQTIEILEISGVDWGEDYNKTDNDYTYRKNGLFVGLGCMNSDTKLKSCVNASRLCEIGVDFDETYDYTLSNGTTKTIEPDGYISLDEVSDSDARAMFSTLNSNSLITYENAYKHKKYDFRYSYPDGFDARLKSELSGDTKSNDYYNFRHGLIPKSYVENQFHRFNNSFYFYFGIKPGQTALDVFNNRYFVPCSEPEINNIIYYTPTLTTNNISNIDLYSATSGGNITDNGGLYITSRGVCWGTTTLPTINDNKTVDGIGDGQYESNLIELENNTTYYIRAYAINPIGVSYGNEITFTTLSESETVLINDISNITTNSVDVNTTIEPGSGSSFIIGGVCWSTSQNPTVNDSYVEYMYEPGTYNHNIINLVMNETYYMRAYATNDFGTYYSAEESFTMLDGNITLETLDIIPQYVDRNWANCRGEILQVNGLPITSYGICYSEQNTTPTISDSVQIGSGYIVDVQPIFTSYLNGLINNMTYYFRAFATNSNGTFYGDIKSFTTLD